MNLVLSLLFVGGGAAAVWAGITNPEGGLWAGLGRMLRGEPEPTSTSDTGWLASSLSALASGAQAGRPSNRRRRNGGGGGFGGDATDHNSSPGNLYGEGKGAAAVAYAQRQIGKPYKWGAEGPDAFDCSGLTMRAWGSAGVTIPRTTTFQQTIGTDVTGGPYEQGDLIFPTATHVQLYAGGGQIIEAPRTGLNVRKMPLGHVYKARRPKH